MAKYIIPESYKVGTGAETVFGFDWPYLIPADVNVAVDGAIVPTILVGTAQVLISPAPAAGAVVHIFRETDAQQPMYVFETGIPFLPKYVDQNNKQLLYALAEGLNEFDNTVQDAIDISQRSLRVPSNENPIPPIADKNTRANSYLGFNDNGDPVMFSPVTGSIGDFATRLAGVINISEGSGMVGFPPENRSLNDKLTKMQVTARRYGGKNDGDMFGNGTDNVTVFQAIIGDIGPLACGRGEIWLDPGIYIVSARPYNPYGVKFVGPGRVHIKVAGAQGPTRQLYSYTRDQTNYGTEHLYKFYQRMKVGGTVRAYLFGDSTIAGGNGETDPYKIENLLREGMELRGYPNIVWANKGVGGTSASDMDALPWIDATGANATDLFVIKYWINDFPKDLKTQYDIMRGKLLDIRAATNGGVNQLSIVLVAASTVNDSVNQRDSRWFEQTQNVYKELCDEFQCAHFNPYALLQDSRSAAGFWMDNPFTDGRCVHMLDVGQNWVWSNFLEFIAPDTAMKRFATNRFVNAPSVTGSPTSLTPATSYNFGISMFRVTPTDGWPDGMLRNDRQADGVTLQTVTPFTGPNGVVATRYWIMTGTGANTWSVWTNVVQGLATYYGPNVGAMGGSRRAPGFRRSSTGRLELQGSIIVNVLKNVGDVVFTALPVGYRSNNGDQVMFVPGSGGGVQLLFTPAGTALAQFAIPAGTTIGLDGGSILID